ncbi:MAG: hypothetical protein ACI309_09335 [Candidatus Limisoma sp.]
MKQKIIAAIAAISVSFCANAIGPNVFNHLGVNAGVGTTGISIEAATPITNFLQLRAGASFVPPIKFHTTETFSYSLMGMPTETSAKVDGDFKRTQGQVILNVYPIPKCSLFVSAGAYFGGDKLIKISGHSDEIAAAQEAGAISTVTIGNYELPLEDNGNVHGSMKVAKVRPYVGIGWGRAIPSKLVNFNVELGVQMHKTPKIYDSNNVEVPISAGLDNDDAYQKIMDKLSVWPVLTFRICGKIF